MTDKSKFMLKFQQPPFQSLGQVIKSQQKTYMTTLKHSGSLPKISLAKLEQTLLQAQKMYKGSNHQSSARVNHKSINLQEYHSHQRNCLYDCSLLPTKSPDTCLSGSPREGAYCTGPAPDTISTSNSDLTVCVPFRIARNAKSDQKHCQCPFHRMKRSLEIPTIQKDSERSHLKRNRSQHKVALKNSIQQERERNKRYRKQMEMRDLEDKKARLLLMTVHHSSSIKKHRVDPLTVAESEHFKDSIKESVENRHKQLQTEVWSRDFEQYLQERERKAHKIAFIATQLHRMFGSEVLKLGDINLSVYEATRLLSKALTEIGIQELMDMQEFTQQQLLMFERTTGLSRDKVLMLIGLLRPKIKQIVSAISSAALLKMDRSALNFAVSMPKLKKVGSDSRMGDTNRSNFRGTKNKFLLNQGNGQQRRQGENSQSVQGTTFEDNRNLDAQLRIRKPSRLSLFLQKKLGLAGTDGDQNQSGLSLIGSQSSEVDLDDSIDKKLSPTNMNNIGEKYNATFAGFMQDSIQQSGIPAMSATANVSNNSSPNHGKSAPKSGVLKKSNKKKPAYLQFGHQKVKNQSTVFAGALMSVFPSKSAAQINGFTSMLQQLNPNMKVSKIIDFFGIENVAEQGWQGIRNRLKLLEGSLTEQQLELLRRRLEKHIYDRYMERLIKEIDQGYKQLETTRVVAQVDPQDQNPKKTHQESLRSTVSVRQQPKRKQIVEATMNHIIQVKKPIQVQEHTEQQRIIIQKPVQPKGKIDQVHKNRLWQQRQPASINYQEGIGISNCQLSSSSRFLSPLSNMNECKRILRFMRRERSQLFESFHQNVEEFSQDLRSSSLANSRYL